MSRRGGNRTRAAIVTLCSLLAFPGLAAPSGVLIGLRDSNNAYRTIWIVAGKSSPTVAVVVKGLLIPRGNGLWRMDVEQETCGEIGQYLVDELRIGPLDSGSGAETIVDCESIAKATCGAVYPAGDGLALERWISYAGPTHFAEVFWSVESCGAYPVEDAGYSVHEMDHPEQDVAIQTAFAADRIDELQGSAREALICGTDDLDCIDSRDRYRVSLSSGWGIVRAASQWSVLVTLLPPGTDRWAPSPVVTGVPPPAAMLGPTKGERVTAVWEGLPEGDQSFSPEGDMAVVRSDRVVAYRLVGGAVEGSPTPVPTTNGEQVVMIEWVAGSQVARWDAVLQRLSNAAAMPPPAKQ